MSYSLGKLIFLQWYRYAAEAFKTRIFNPTLVSTLSVNFRIFSLFLRIYEICCLLILNLRAKFVPFSLFFKCDIGYSRKNPHPHDRRHAGKSHGFRNPDGRGALNLKIHPRGVTFNFIDVSITLIDKF